MPNIDLYSKLLRLHCFTHEDVEKLTGGVKNADNEIFSLKKNGLIRSIRKNLYTAVSLSDKSSVAEPFEIASKVSSFCCVSHHSAFEYYGFANQVYYDVYVSTPRRFSQFDFEGRTYKPVITQNTFGIENKRHLTVTDLERTVLDSIKDLEKIGGFEETIFCLSLISEINEEKLLEYLSYYKNQFLYQKAGFILSHLENFNLSENFLETCKKNKGQSVRYIDGKKNELVFSKEWNLCIPPKYLELLKGMKNV